MKHRVCLLIATLALISHLTVPVLGSIKIEKITTTCMGGCVSPKLKTKARVVKSVLVLPAQVEMTKRGMKGAESMVQEAEVVSVTLREAVIKALQEKGLKLDDSSMKAANEDSEIRAEVGSLQKRYNAVALQLNKKPKDLNKGRFSLGDEIASFTPGTANDALVFIRAWGGQETKAKAFMSGGGLLGMALAGTDIQYSISLVDAKTGEVLYVASGLFRLKDGDLPKHIDKGLTNNFKKLPVGS